MRIAFIRSVEVNQARPWLQAIEGFAKKKGLELKLFYTDGICPQELFPGEIEKVSPDISVEGLVEKIVAWAPDRVISLSIPDNNSLRDAFVREILESRHGIPTIMHSVEATHILCSKWLTKEFVRSLGYATPNGFLVDGDLLNARGVKYSAYADYVKSQAAKLGYPLIVKPLWDSMSCGMRVLKNEQDLSLMLTDDRPECNVVIEKFLDGEFFTMEAVGFRGQVQCQPLGLRFMDSGASLLPFDHLRCAPFRSEGYDLEGLRRMVRDVARKLDICGALDFELIHYDGRFHIMEINPRVSGTTTISVASSDVNTYVSLIEMALGGWRPVEKAHEDCFLAVEMPVRPLSAEAIADIAALPYVVTINKFQLHDGRQHSKMIMRSRGFDECFERLASLESKYELIPPRIMANLKRFRDKCAPVAIAA